MVAHACDPSIWESEVGGSYVREESVLQSKAKKRKGKIGRNEKAKGGKEGIKCDKMTLINHRKRFNLYKDETLRCQKTADIK